MKLTFSPVCETVFTNRTREHQGCWLKWVGTFCVRGGNGPVFSSSVKSDYNFLGLLYHSQALVA